MIKVTMAVATAVVLFSGAAAAQTTTAAPAAAPGLAPKAAANCFRLPLSDVAFGTEGATRYAREKLDDYAQAEMKKRRWPSKPLVKSNETVSCDVYLNLGPLGTEYRCLVTATFCQK
jgi:hypothetical protein